MICYEILNAQTHIGSLLVLIAENNKEVFGDNNMDISSFMSLVKANLVRIFVVTDDGKIVGYASYGLNYDMYNAHILQADNLGVYVTPKYRGKVVFKLIAFAEMHLKYMDVKKINVFTNNSDKLQRLYARQGYEVANIQMSKRI